MHKGYHFHYVTILSFMYIHCFTFGVHYRFTQSPIFSTTLYSSRYVVSSTYVLGLKISSSKFLQFCVLKIRPVTYPSGYFSI